MFNLSRRKAVVIHSQQSRQQILYFTYCTSTKKQLAGPRERFLRSDILDEDPWRYASDRFLDAILCQHGKATKVSSLPFSSESTSER